jgi:tRNA-splicing ligase RtcB
MKVPARQIEPYVWEIPTSYKKEMRVPARIFASPRLFESMDDGVFDQVTNVACLPGIRGNSLCMPDGHWGYGFPIGGVAAFDPQEGVISPGGIGFDINCGMRLITSSLGAEEVLPRLEPLVNELFRLVPAGVGCRGTVELGSAEFRKMIVEGAGWCVRNGYGWEEDTEFIEDEGRIAWADPDTVSDRALKRGMHQLGTLGSGNHYLEVQLVKAENIRDAEAARAMGIEGDGQVVVMVHCGSRGFGHQVATDYLQVFADAMKRYGIRVRDKQLACAPFGSPEGQRYFKAMACAANNAFANRQVITHQIREAFSRVFERDARGLGMRVIYDVAHNIAKVEEHDFEGRRTKLLVHRKGATRSFGPDRPEVPKAYRKLGQPVIVGGSMETGSYLLVGAAEAMSRSFGSTLHGSGRTMSRSAAKRMVRGEKLQRDMMHRGIYVRAASMRGLAEEAGRAYKNIDDVVESVERVGLSRPVAQLRPVGNVKG